MSYEVILIYAVIGIGVFFFLRLFLRRIIKDDFWRGIFVWAGTVVITPIIYFLVLVLIVSLIFSENTQEFNQEKWLSNRELRIEMRDDLVEREILRNKTKNEVLGIMGQPDLGGQFHIQWTYDLGTSLSGLGVLHCSLIVTFEDDVVSEIELKEISD